MKEPVSLPSEPLIRAIEHAAILKGYVLGRNRLPGMREFCEATFGFGNLVQHLRQNHLLSPTRADRLACQLGTHPVRIWGEVWLVAFPSDEEEEAVHLAAQSAYRQRQHELRSHRKRRARNREAAA